jgi:hypothetical protein
MMIKISVWGITVKERSRINNGTDFATAEMVKFKIRVRGEKGYL